MATGAPVISFGEYAAFLRQSATEVEPRLAAVLAIVTESAAEAARNMIGHYQDADGPFPAWAPLSPATLEGFVHPLAGYIPGKIELGYAPPDNPLLRTGDMRESIGAWVEGLTGVVGSDSPIALWQEMGTPNARYPIPPRPFLALAAYQQITALEALAEEVAVQILVPEAA